MPNRGVVVVLSLCGLAAGVARAQPVLARDRQDAPVIVCFAPGTDPLYAKRVEAMIAAQNARRFGAADYQLSNRWTPYQGHPYALTWSFVPDGILIPPGANEAGGNSILFATFDAGFAAQGGRATWVNRFQQVFNRWQALVGLTYTRITVNGTDWDDGAPFQTTPGAPGLRGDIRIGGHSIDGASNILAYDYLPTNSDMVLDTDDVANFASAANQNLFLRNTVAHEHGHGMGLLHVDPTNGSKLMEAFLNTGFDGPRQDDIRGGQWLYGDAYEPNDTAATAKPLGALAAGSPINFGTIPAPVALTSDANASIASIDYDGKVDFWSFTIATPVQVSITLTPVGSSYQQGPQGGSTASTNALTAANLGAELIATNGTTVLGSATGQGAGSNEIISGVVLPITGTYFIRVFETNTPTDTQCYKLALTATTTTVCPTITTQPSPQSACAGGSVTFTVAVSASPAPTYQWRKNTQPIALATGPSYTVNPVGAGNIGSYDCIITNSCGSAASDSVGLALNTPPQISLQPAPLLVYSGAQATFTVAASGTPAPTFQWRKDGNAIAGATGDSFTIAAATAGDAGLYDCLITNACATVPSSGAQLAVACYANCDASTTAPVLNALDFSCFLSAFAAGDSFANCDGSTTVPVLNALDFSCFLSAFAAGCT